MSSCQESGLSFECDNLNRLSDVNTDEPGVNFINVICARFLYKIFGAKTSDPKHSFVIFGAKIVYEKRVRKTLMKLTPEVSTTGCRAFLIQETYVKEIGLHLIHFDFFFIF